AEQRGVVAAHHEVLERGADDRVEEHQIHAVARRELVDHLQHAAAHVGHAALGRHAAGAVDDEAEVQRLARRQGPLHGERELQRVAVDGGAAEHREELTFGDGGRVEAEVVEQLVRAHLRGGRGAALVHRPQQALGAREAHAVVVREVDGGAPVEGGAGRGGHLARGAHLPLGGVAAGQLGHRLGGRGLRRGRGVLALLGGGALVFHRVRPEGRPAGPVAAGAGAHALGAQPAE
ncbi:MAG: hypothetical protein ACK559_29770, partial [bacterium]